MRHTGWLEGATSDVDCQRMPLVELEPWHELVKHACEGLPVATVLG